MKIESVQAFYLRMPEVLDIGDGSQDALLIRVEAGDHVGWGECEASPLPTLAALVAPISHSACHPVLDSVLGQSLDSPDDILRINRLVRQRSMDLLQAAHALSGIDIALWDLMARKKGVPIWSLIGGENRPKIAYASLLFGATPEETYNSAREVSRSRFRAAKFGWGAIGKGSVKEDNDQIGAAREGLGPDRQLFVDTGCAFSHDVDKAAARVQALESAKIGWWEEPFEGGALAEYSALSARTEVPLAGGEEAHSFDQARHLIDYGRVRFIQIDCGRIGGITAAREIALYARGKQVSYVNHTFTSNLALSASLQPYADIEGCYAEVPVATSTVARVIGGEPWTPDHNGLIWAPEQPGLGLDIELSAMQQFVVDVEIQVDGRAIWKSNSP